MRGTERFVSSVFKKSMGWGLTSHKSPNGTDEIYHPLFDSNFLSVSRLIIGLLECRVSIPCSARWWYPTDWGGKSLVNCQEFQQTWTHFGRGSAPRLRWQWHWWGEGRLEIWCQIGRETFWQPSGHEQGRGGLLVVVAVKVPDVEFKANATSDPWETFTWHGSSISEARPSSASPDSPSYLPGCRAACEVVSMCLSSESQTKPSSSGTQVARRNAALASLPSTSRAYGPSGSVSRISSLTKSPQRLFVESPGMGEGETLTKCCAEGQRWRGPGC